MPASDRAGEPRRRPRRRTAAGPRHAAAGAASRTPAAPPPAGAAGPPPPAGARRRRSCWCWSPLGVGAVGEPAARGAHASRSTASRSLSAAEVRARPPGSPRAPRCCGSTSTRGRGPGRAAAPGRRRSTVTRGWPDRVVITVAERVAGRRGRAGRAAVAAWTPTGVLFDTITRQPPRRASCPLTVARPGPGRPGHHGRAGGDRRRCRRRCAPEVAGRRRDATPARSPLTLDRRHRGAVGRRPSVSAQKGARAGRRCSQQIGRRRPGAGDARIDVSTPEAVVLR